MLFGEAIERAYTTFDNYLMHFALVKKKTRHSIIFVLILLERYRS